MVHFQRYNLPNGLRLLVHTDNSTPIVAVNLLYDVGARDEDPQRTGFAHLFEHLMFEGSVHIPDFDNALQIAAGENNAFTNNDITNYYLTIPRENLETAFWLESDRMKELAFSEEKLNIQKNVVTEEYRQSYLNQPYGDVWMLLRQLAYQVHPYQWSTIGKSIEHVQQASLEEVKDFFYTYYRPNNAILVVAGDVIPDEIYALSLKWFGEIPAGLPNERNLPAEPAQRQARRLEVERDVPFDEIYMAFPTGTRLDDSYYTTDLLSDILSNGQSSRLIENLVKKEKLFSEANAWITGSRDLGLFVLTGKLLPGRSLQEAEMFLWKELERLKSERIPDLELQKVKNKLEASHTLSEVGILARAMNLAYYEWLGDADLLNKQQGFYQPITTAHLQATAQKLFKTERSSVLYYKAKPRT